MSEGSAFTRALDVATGGKGLSPDQEVQVNGIHRMNDAQLALVDALLANKEMAVATLYVGQATNGDPIEVILWLARRAGRRDVDRRLEPGKLHVDDKRRKKARTR